LAKKERGGGRKTPSTKHLKQQRGKKGGNMGAGEPSMESKHRQKGLDKGGGKKKKRGGSKKV